MSYAYHIPGRAALELDSDLAAAVRKVGTNNPLDDLPDFTEKNDLIDPDLIELTQGQGRLFHFYDFSIFGGARNMNFWENKNEFYPNTSDYLMIDANAPGVTVEDLRGSNVRHHHMPSNVNSDMRTIVSNNSNIDPATESTTTVYYFHTDATGDNEGGEFNELPLQDFSSESNIIDYESPTVFGVPTELGWGDWEDGSDDLQSEFGPISDWTYSIPTEADIAGGDLRGYFLWRKAGGFPDSGFTEAEVYQVDDTTVYIDQIDVWGIGDGTSDMLGSRPNDDNFQGYFVWTSTTQAVEAAGSISQEVRPLGVRLSDIKIPHNIANKVQGFRIYYAERKHSNRRIIGQDVLKHARDIGQRNISGCGADLAGNGSNEEFILSPGALYNGEINTATFHDFYLLHRKNSLVPATHSGGVKSIMLRCFL